ncbi:MAG: histidine kinase [Bacteroidales bacterium]
MKRQILHTNILILLIFFLPQVSPSQIYEELFVGFNHSSVDSILKILPGLENRDLADAYNKLSRLHLQYHPDSAMFFANKAFDVAQNAAYTEGMGTAHLNIGKVKYFEGNYIEAYKIFLEAKTYLEKTENKIDLADCYIRLAGSLFWSQAMQETAIDLANRGLALYRETGNLRYVAYLYMLFGRYYIDIGDLVSALKGLQLTKEIMVDQNMGNRFDKYISFVLIAEVLWYKEEQKKALDFIRQGYSFLDTSIVEDCGILSNNYSITAFYFRNMNNPDSAIHYYNRGIILGEKAGCLSGLEANHKGLADLYKDQGKIEKTLLHYRNALLFSLIIDSTGFYYINPEHRFYRGISLEIGEPFPVKLRRYYGWHTMRKIHHELYNIYNERGNCQKALIHFVSFSSMNDSIQTYLKNKELKELGFKYDTEQKDQRIFFLEQENKLKETTAKQTRIIFVGIGLVMFLAIIVLILMLMQGKLRNIHNTLNLEQKLFRSQMNPHFIFNSLASIQNKIINEEPDMATDYLARFSLLFRNILENSIDEMITLQKEIETINTYLELQQLRYIDKFDFKIYVDENLDPENIFIPPMLAQPFIENAIEHGIKHIGSKGNIHVRFMLNEQTLVYEVEDDGIGREKAQEILLKQNKDHKSLATSITQERIKVLNKKLKHKIKLEIIDLKNEEGEATGTRVVFELPM